MTIPWTYLTIDGVRPLNKTCQNINVDWTFIETGGRLVRLANGQRRSLRRRQFDKYRISISGDAVRKPAIDHLKVGDIVEIGFPGHFDLPGDVADEDLPRPAMEGSIRRFGEVNGQVVPLNHGDPGIVVTAFRPILQVMIDNADCTERTGEARVSWNIAGEEV